MKRVRKKGLSPVIASVLLIMLVMVLAAIIFLWARGFIGEQVEKFGGPIEQSCDAVDFDVSITGQWGSELEVLNKGNIDIRRLDIRMTREGNSEVRQFDFQIDAGASERDHVTLVMSDGETPDEIIAYPVLIGTVKGSSSNNVFACMDSGRVIS